MLLDGVGVVAGGDLGQAVAEMADAGDDEFFGVGDVERGGDPGDGVAAFLDGIYEGALVARDVVEKMDGWHGEGEIMERLTRGRKSCTKLVDGEMCDRQICLLLVHNERQSLNKEMHLRFLKSRFQHLDRATRYRLGLKTASTMFEYGRIKRRLVKQIKEA